ncbi:GntR family transcriptional regulator [Streptomyces sp. NPDC050315]|uniref:GntR family transcriptional regulator n=1 Tax=Streptomyces sp. NPDC050315 TaxID=3155039 RepID=UPI00344A8023
MASRYEQIAADLRRQIQEGALTAGARLPSESALANEYRVGAPTVRQALGVLQSEGLIEKQHGRGNFVRAVVPQIEYANDRQSPAGTLNKRADDHGRWVSGPAADLTVSVTCCEMKASGDVATRMEVPPGTRLLEFTHRGQRPKDDKPCTLVRSYLLYDMVAAAPVVPVAPVSDDFPWGDAYQGWLANAGIKLDYVVERLTARPPSAEEAIHLGVVPGVSVIAIQRTSIDVQGQVVEVADLLMSGDRVAAVYTTPVAAACTIC